MEYLGPRANAAMNAQAARLLSCTLCRRFARISTLVRYLAGTERVWGLGFGFRHCCASPRSCRCCKSRERHKGRDGGGDTLDREGREAGVGDRQTEKCITS